MVGAAIKGLSKILRKGLRKSPVLGKYAKKPKPRYRTDPKTGQKFLNRRATVAGVTGVQKKTLKSNLEKAKPYAIGAVAGAATAYGISKTDKFKKTAKKLKEATEKHREKDKNKKEKRKDNYGGR